MSSRPSTVVDNVHKTTNGILAKLKDLEDKMVRDLNDISKEQARIYELEGELESERDSLKFYMVTVEDLKELLAKNHKKAKKGLSELKARCAEQEAALKECLHKAEVENKP